EIKYANNNRTTFTITGRIENREFRKASDSITLSDQFTFSVFLQAPGSQTYQKTGELSFALQKNKDYNIKQNFDVAAPLFWSPANPASYKIRLELRRGDALVDRTDASVAVYNIKPKRDSILFNGSTLKIKGVTYIPSFYQMGSLASYDKMESDISLIKEAGFNAVRFAKNVPHPYYLVLCQKLGLLAFIEIPLNGLPEGAAAEPNFIVRSKNFISHFIDAYSKYSSVAAIGLGGGYLPNLTEHKNYLEKFGGIIKKETNFITYASFAGVDLDEIPNIDLYGVELFNTSINEVGFDFTQLQNRMGRGRIFISEATCTVNSGNSDGYLNRYSFEAQAKYFEDLLNYSEQKPLLGYFINSMFDYSGDFASFSCGFTENNLYTIGLSGFERKTGRLSYKVVTAKQNNTERVTIPIGSKKDEAPMLFIIFGLGLAIILGVLVNSGKKFREDSSRALWRPYNFFADVRDQRLMSGFQSTTLLLIIMGISALLLSNLLFYLKMNIIFEKLILSFGSEWLMKSINYLAWNPLMSLVWLTLLSGASLIMLVLIIKISASFVHNIVFLSSSFFTVIWSFLPLVLLIPVGIILYRVLEADVANLYIYILLAVFALWIIHRTIKGIYVIFDVSPGSVYFYSFLLIALFLGGLIFYFNYTNSFFALYKIGVKTV
ncbi:MAG: hypothetical protein K8H86_11745, partial [Ignavibacteriaceae bacterium]|nr:hypothetical protein [Ignavibacteriaceae bacterium]